MMEWLSTGGSGWMGAMTGLVLSLVVACVASEIAARFVRFALLTVVRGEAHDLRSPVLRRPVRVIRTGVFVLVALILVIPSLRLGGLESRFGPQPEALARWLFGSGLRVALIALVAYALIWIAGVVVRRLEEELASDTVIVMEERLKRVRTLGGLLHNVFGVGVLAIALLMMLRELQIDVTPVLTGAGIVGLAVGFGAQTLVKDVITGFFLILENQVRVGDVAVINGTGGLVEAINLRTIVLRDQEGSVHIFPNGSIATLANRTKDYSYAVLNVAVAINEDLDRVTALLRRVGHDLSADPEFGPRLLEPLEVLGIDALETSQMTIQIRVKTLPRRQWDVARALRARIRQAFTDEQVRMPAPLVAVSFGPGSPPFDVRQVGGEPAP